MRFLIVGLGSMGKRRIRNLQYLKQNDIIGFDLREDRRKEVEEKYKINTYSNINDALKQKPDVFIISTPPNHHIEYELMAAEKEMPFFCEAGIFQKDLERLIEITKKEKILAAPSCTSRFHFPVKKIKELVDANKVGKMVALTYHLGQYLPDWHPWENITDFYAGQKETAATREMVPFELEWLVWIFGDIDELSCIKGKVSNIKADIEDVYQLVFRFKKGIIGNFLVEVVSRTPTRIFRLIGEEGTIEWDWMAEKVRLYEAKTKKWTEFIEEVGFKEKGYVSKENPYIEEIQHFLNALSGKEIYRYTLEEDYHILTLLEAAEKAADSKKHFVAKGD